MRFVLKHISFFYFLVLLAGTLFFIPPIFVNRFTVGPSLWLQIGIAIGLLFFIVMKRERIHLPGYKFLLIVLIFVLYFWWREKWNSDALFSVALYCTAFLLFFQLYSDKINRNKLISIYTPIAVLLCVWCGGQLVGWIPSFHNTLRISGPFDNPAGISVSLSLLLPFTLYKIEHKNKWERVLGIIISAIIIFFVLKSGARAAIIAITLISGIYITRWIKIRTNVQFSSVHYFLMFAVGIMLFTGLYLMKKDSADGRILIWKCTEQLIEDKPVFGFGRNGFTANYMNKQALYFTKYPNSKYAMLADNIRQPFNEYLKITVEYGIAGFILVSLILFYPLYHSRNNTSRVLFAVRLSLLAIATCAMFSYPFNYPFVRIMLVMLLSYLLASGNDCKIEIANNLFVKSLTLLISTGLISAAVFQGIHEREWHTIAHKSLSGQTIKMLPRYSSLYTHMQHNDLFLYNYAAELNVAGLYDESYKIARECNSLWADYDLQMLMADNCLQLQQYDKTESHLKKAAAMCPVKFMPLYRLAELYMETGRKNEAMILAQIVEEKDVKIPSSVISSIKIKMKNFVNKSE